MKFAIQIFSCTICALAEEQVVVSAVSYSADIENFKQLVKSLIVVLVVWQFATMLRSKK